MVCHPKILDKYMLTKTAKLINRIMAYGWSPSDLTRNQSALLQRYFGSEWKKKLFYNEKYSNKVIVVFCRLCGNLICTLEALLNCDAYCECQDDYDEDREDKDYFQLAIYKLEKPIRYDKLKEYK